MQLIYLFPRTEQIYFQTFRELEKTNYLICASSQIFRYINKIVK